MTRTRWLAGTGVLPPAIVGAALTVALAWRSQLPDSLPNRGGVGDTPVSTTLPVDMFVAVLVGASALTWVGGLAVFLVSGRLHGAARHWIRVVTQVGANVVAAMMATVLLMVLYPARGAATAADVRFSTGYFAAAVALPMVAAAVAGAAAYLLAGRPPARDPQPPAGDVSALPVAAGERLLWWESRSLRPVWWLVAGLAASGVLLVAVLVPLVGVTGWAGLAPLVSALALVPFATYRLTIDGESVRTRIGFFRRQVPMTAIVSAEQAELPTRDWLTQSMLRGATARDLPLLPGPALALHLADGTRHLVTCRDITTAASVVNTLRPNHSPA